MVKLSLERSHLPRSNTRRIRGQLESSAKAREEAKRKQARAPRVRKVLKAESKTQIYSADANDQGRVLTRLHRGAL